VSGSRQQGFTLFEVLVVLAIIALVTAIMAPALFRGFGGTQARAAAYEIAAALRRARNEAVAANADVAVVFDLARGAYAPERARARAVPEVLHLELYAAEVEQLDATTGGIRFFPDGSATGGQVTVEGEAARYQVDVDWLTGRISVLDAPGG
jgi:general secretion pathway protein H